jgi:hypothetical protein
MNLTKAQQAAYEELQRCDEYHCSPDYKPAQKLVELGLAEDHRGKFGGYWLTLKHADRERKV